MSKSRVHPFDPKTKSGPIQQPPIPTVSAESSASISNPKNPAPPGNDSVAPASPTRPNRPDFPRSMLSRGSTPSETVGLTVGPERKFIVIDDQILNLDHILFIRRYPRTDSAPASLIIDFTPHFNRLNPETNIDEFRPHFLTIKGPVADDVWRFIIQHKAAAQFNSTSYRPPYST